MTTRSGSSLYYPALDALDLGLSTWPLVGLKLGATLAVSVASFHWIETPVRSRRVLVGPLRWLAVPVAVSLVATLAVAAIVSAPEEATYEVVGMPEVAPPGDESLHRPLPNIVVVGDSIAAGVGTALRRWGFATDSARFSVYSFAGCGLAKGGKRKLFYGPEKELAEMCQLLERTFPTVVEKHDADAVVLLFGPMDLVDRKFPGRRKFMRPGDRVFDVWLTREYLAAADVLIEDGARLVWLTTPCAQPKKQSRLRAFDAQSSRYLNEIILPRVQARRPHHIEIVDLFSRVCPDGVFTHEIGPFDDARADGAHFEHPEADWLAKWLGPKILAALPRQGELELRAADANR